MTIWIMPEFDREGWAVCLFWLQGGKHNETPTEKNLACLSPHGGPSDPPFIKRRKEGLTGFPNKKQLTA